MKVKPWATTEETLAALHTTLVARHQCQIFWTSLCGLLENLARDLVARQEASPGSLVDNELLDSERYATLLDEIRAALAVQTAAPATFRHLASALSAPALALLLLLGGAASVSCDRAGLHGTTQDAGLPDVTDAPVTQPAANPDVASIPIAVPDSSPDVSVIARDGLASLSPDAFVSNPDVASIPVQLPDASPDASPAHDAFASRAADARAPTQSDGATVTIQDILQSCNISGQGVLDCLAKLRASWTTGVAESLAGKDCQTIAIDLSCFFQTSCSGAPSSGDFDPKAFVCPPVLIYLGVRFV